MSDQIYKQNYDLLKEKCGWIYDDLEALPSQQQNVYVYETAQHTVGMYLDFQEKGIVQLGSQYDPKGYAATWCAAAMRDNPFEKNAFIFIFGFGSGEYVEALLNRATEENVIFIYEPDLNILSKILESIDLTTLLAKEKVYLISSGEQGKLVLEATLTTCLTLSNVCDVKLYELPNYGNVYEKEYIYFVSLINQMIWKVGAVMNTQNSNAVKFAENQLNSAAYILRCSSAEALLERLPKGVPGIVIAAGPSLQKNIQELKRAKGKAFLVATDSALKPLLENGIVPDLHVTIDYNKNEAVFQHPKTWDIPLLVCADSKNEIVPRARNKVFLIDVKKNSILKTLLSVVEKEDALKYFRVSGSVAHAALEVLMQAEMNPIIFVGQDLAYPEDKLHVDGVFEQNSVIQEKKYKMVEDIYGNQVKSDYMMGVFREWIEYIIKTSENVRFIDATEGGAKIQGTEIRTLKDVIDTECTKEFDFEAMILELPDMLPEQDKEKYLNVLFGLEEELANEKEKAQELADCYDALNRLSENEDINQSKLNEQLEKIAELTTYFDEEALLYPIIVTYIAQVRNKVTLQLSKKKDAVNEELQHLIQNGIEIAEGIILGIEQLEPIVGKFVQQLRKENTK